MPTRDGMSPRREPIVVCILTCRARADLYASLITCPSRNGRVGTGVSEALAETYTEPFSEYLDHHPKKTFSDDDSGDNLLQPSILPADSQVCWIQRRSRASSPRKASRSPCETTRRSRSVVLRMVAEVVTTTTRTWMTMMTSDAALVSFTPALVPTSFLPCCSFYSSFICSKSLFLRLLLLGVTGGRDKIPFASMCSYQIPYIHSHLSHSISVCPGTKHGGYCIPYE